MSEDESETEQNSQFEWCFNCTQLVYSKNKNIERGGKVLLPLWVLEVINDINTPLPFLFKITNESNSLYSHVGVLEFTSDKDQVCIPLWLMKHLCLKEGDKVRVNSVSLPSATYCKLVPLTRNAAYISNTKAVFEENLGNFSCLTQGDVLSIYETNKLQIYKVKVVDTKPESAVSILNCDVELDFDLPEKIKPQEKCKINNSRPITAKSKLFTGQGFRLGGKSVEASKSQNLENREKNTCAIKLLTNSAEGDPKPSRKTKAARKDEDEPQSKRHCSEENVTKQLVFIRDGQKEFVKKEQSNDDNEDKFPGKGFSLKD